MISSSPLSRFAPNKNRAVSGFYLVSLLEGLEPFQAPVARTTKESYRHWVNLSMEIKVTANQIKIKANGIFKCIGIGSLAMVCMTLFQFLPFDGFDFSFDTSFDIFGYLFLCFWFTVVLSMGGVAFFIGCKTVTIDETGVSCKSLCYNKTLTWEEIKDYGASYSGQTRGQGNTYTLYFAAKEQKAKSDCKKS